MARGPLFAARGRRGFFARGVAAARGWRWARTSIVSVRRDVRGAGLGVDVTAPPTVERGSLRGARLALRRDRASCLERSLVIQRWFAAKGIALDVIVGVRHPNRHDGPLGHAWVEHWDDDWSAQFGEIRRVPAPEGRAPKFGDA